MCGPRPRTRLFHGLGTLFFFFLLGKHFRRTQLFLFPPLRASRHSRTVRPLCAVFAPLMSLAKLSGLLLSPIGKTPPPPFLEWRTTQGVYLFFFFKPVLSPPSHPFPGPLSFESFDSLFFFTFFFYAIWLYFL